MVDLAVEQIDRTWWVVWRALDAHGKVVERGVVRGTASRDRGTVVEYLTDFAVDLAVVRHRIEWNGGALRVRTDRHMSDRRSAAGSVNSQTATEWRVAAGKVSIRCRGGNSLECAARPAGSRPWAPRRTQARVPTSTNR